MIGDYCATKENLCFIYSYIDMTSLLANGKLSLKFLLVGKV